ncbi:MAG: hypothetical protein ABTQ27_12425 [Amaricoccus sp.]|uniref:hypothetical protein n=1 Tax=Amaricoccus sp. TaxID=1872485 RepID=UPI003314C8F9
MIDATIFRRLAVTSGSMRGTGAASCAASRSSVSEKRATASGWRSTTGTAAPASSSAAFAARTWRWMSAMPVSSSMTPRE